MFILTAMTDPGALHTPQQHAPLSSLRCLLVVVPFQCQFGTVGMSAFVLSHCLSSNQLCATVASIKVQYALTLCPCQHDTQS